MSISVQDLHFSYARREVLDGLSAHAQAGRITALLGPNAAGKSTLLRCVIGALKPTRGTVLMDGAPVHRMSSRELAARLAYVSQRSAVSARFSVREVIELGRYALSRDPDRVDAAIEHLALEALVDRPYPELSVGQQQRVMLARALAQLSATGHLILDEPMAGMDLRHVHDGMARLRDLADSGITVVMAMHDIGLAAAVADDIWLLEQGRLVAGGQVDQVLRPDRLEALFGVRFQWLKDGRGTRHLLAGTRARANTRRSTAQ